MPQLTLRDFYNYVDLKKKHLKDKIQTYRYIIKKKKTQQ